ncbi:MAG TPA: hypothetical protein VHG51_19490 [Longimicrobiaceae bacterium]|nr:hypothetical protein [Longimicrobiaceae bacterium]
MIDPEVEFSDEETRQILAAAAARQEEAEQYRVAGRSGLTLAALQEVAREAGLDPQHVRAAAGDVLLRRSAPPAETRLGLPLALDARRVVSGTVSDAQWERMVAEFRAAFGKSGMVSQFGAVREWVSGNEAGGMPVRVRLEPVDGDTLVTLHQPTRMVTELVYAVGGTFAGFAALLGTLVAVGEFEPRLVLLPVLLLVLAVLSSLGTWGGYRAWMPRQEERFRTVLDRVELIARAG